MISNRTLLAVDLVQLLVQNWPMIKLNIHEAKTHLSRYLERLAEGETILLCRRNEPIAEIRPLTPKRTTPRPLGLANGTIQIPPEFFEPLPDAEVALFEGRGI